MSIATAWELQLEVWTEVIFAVRSGRKKCGVIRSGLGGVEVNTRRGGRWSGEEREGEGREF